MSNDRMGGRSESAWKFLEPLEKDWVQLQEFSDPSLPWHEMCQLKRNPNPGLWRTSWKSVPTEVASFWSIYREGVLFKNVEYGQWGLHLLSPAKAKKATNLNRRLERKGLKPTDIVLGEFFGDLQLLVIDKQGRAMIAAPLDDRPDWYRHRGGLRSFLRKYVKHAGKWFWDPSSA